MAESKRVAKWDNLKFFLILTVVIGHVAELYCGESSFLKGVFSFIYLFHMPAFIFVSGLLSKRTIDTKNYKKIMPYITLYFFTKFLLFIFSAICRGTEELTLFTEKGVPWFILSLFFMNVITMFTKQFKPQWVLAISVLFSVFAGYNSTTIDQFALLRTINFYPFFYLGYILNSDKILQKLQSKWLKAASFVFLAAVAAACVLFEGKVYSIVPLLTGCNVYSKLGEYAAYGGVLRLALFAFSMIMVFALICAVPSKKFAFSELGKRTLAVYVTHYCFIYILFVKFDIQQMIRAAAPTGWQIIILVIGALIALICSNSLFDKALKKLMNFNLKLREPPKT